MTKETIIIGGGQAGLALSYFLKLREFKHVVLEQSAAPANAWRNGRWDSFTLVSPNWTFNLPGASYSGDAPDGFMPRTEIIKAFEDYIENYHLPVIYNQRVHSVTGNKDKRFIVKTDDNEYYSDNVIIAAGLFQKARIPNFSSKIPSGVLQLHSGEYRNPGLLPPGAVLVIGSGQSGCQITEELIRSGRKVYLSTGSAGRAIRRYRGKDIFRWFDLIGFTETMADQLPDPSAKFKANPHLSGVRGGSTINLHKFVKQGAVLLGHIEDADDHLLKFVPDLKENLSKADAFESEIIKMIDQYIEQNEIEAPEEIIPEIKDGYLQEEITELDLKTSGISVIIWASGYSFNFDFVKFPVFDNFGYPIQNRGITNIPGLYFLGLPWLYKQKSGLLLGISEDAEYLAKKITGS